MKKVVFIFSLVLFTSCQNDEDKSINPTDVRSSMISYQILPLHERFLTSTANLQSEINQLSKDLSNAQLEIIKGTWRDCASDYSKVEIYNIGDVDDSNIHFGIYSWKALSSLIENQLSKTMSDVDINTLPTGTRGLAAIEYLLFFQDTSVTLDSLSNEIRMSYLLAISENLHGKVLTLNELWTNQSDNFINNADDGLSGSLNQLVNRIINTLTLIKKNKIGLPAGLESTPSNPELLQADYSLYSLELVQANLESIDDLYFSSENSLSLYVSYLSGNQEINNEIRSAFDHSLHLIQEMNEPLSTVIINQPDKVQALFAEIKTLIRLFSADVSSVLSIVVTPTEADGD